MSWLLLDALPVGLAGAADVQPVAQAVNASAATQAPSGPSSLLDTATLCRSCVKITRQGERLLRRPSWSAALPAWSQVGDRIGLSGSDRCSP